MYRRDGDVGMGMGMDGIGMGWDGMESKKISFPFSFLPFSGIFSL